MPKSIKLAFCQLNDLCCSKILHTCSTAHSVQLHAQCTPFTQTGLLTQSSKQLTLRCLCRTPPRMQGMLVQVRHVVHLSRLVRSATFHIQATLTGLVGYVLFFELPHANQKSRDASRSPIRPLHQVQAHCMPSCTPITTE